MTLKARIERLEKRPGAGAGVVVLRQDYDGADRYFDADDKVYSLAELESAFEGKQVILITYSKDWPPGGAA